MRKVWESIQYRISCRIKGYTPVSVKNIWKWFQTTCYKHIPKRDSFSTCPTLKVTDIMGSLSCNQSDFNDILYCNLMCCCIIINFKASMQHGKRIFSILKISLSVKIQYLWMWLEYMFSMHLVSLCIYCTPWTFLDIRGNRNPLVLQRNVCERTSSMRNITYRNGCLFQINTYMTVSCDTWNLCTGRR